MKCNKRDKDGMYVNEPCDTCGNREVIFSGVDTTTKFGSWLFNDEHRETTVFAHNMKAYDGVFLLDNLLQNGLRPAKIIYNGTKIMYMEIQRGLNIRVLDSLNFLPMEIKQIARGIRISRAKKGQISTCI